jgi:cell division protein FtsI (penicillin-binding protein 3)
LIRLSGSFSVSNFPQRVAWVRRIIIFVGLIILLRSLYMQVVERPALELLAERQHSQVKSVKMQRGPIFDSQGKILAVSLPMNSVFAIPTEVENVEKTATELSKILNIDPSIITKKLKAKVTFTWLKRNNKPRVSQIIRELNFPGIHQLVEYQRFYPLESIAAQVIGFSGVDSQGLEGLEVYYNKHLMNGKRHQFDLEANYSIKDFNKYKGGALKLTIDSKLQYYITKELKIAVAAMKAQHGIAIVMASNSGKILTMTNVPDFNPNRFEKFNQSTYFNRAVASIYEPGSTFKVITIATAIDNKVIAKNDIFNCEEGAYQIQDRVIHDIGKYAWLSVDKIIQKSSNICAAKIGQMIPRPVFYKKIRDFGFGSSTAIGLPGEIRGRVFDYQKWSETDVATMSYGHSISVTPIQLISAINSIANDGILLQPYIVDQVLKADGSLIPQKMHKEKRVIKAETAAVVKDFMIGVTQKGGTGYSASIPGIVIAGKTGTSKKFNAKKGEYSSDNFVSSFVGFFPANNPKYTVLIIIDDPRQKYLGYKSASPVFRKIAQQIIKHESKLMPWQIDSTALPMDTKNILFEHEVTEKAKEKNLPKTLNSVQPKVFNKTMREVLRFGTESGLKFKMTGSGKVFSVKVSHQPSYDYLLKFR